MSTTQTLLNDVQQGVPSGNYDGSSLDFASDAAAGPGYYQGNAGTQTVAVRVTDFDGRIQLQGTLDCLPGENTNWVSLAEFDTSDSAATYTEIVTVTGQFVWIRARVLNFLDGTINSVTSTYAGAGADIGGGSDVTAGVFSSVTANAVYVGTTGLVSSGNITAPYFLGNGSQLTGITGLDSFSVSTLPPSGDGALVYNTGNGVFQFTPADAGASDYGNANVSAYAESGWAGNIVPGQDSVYSLGNAARQWSELWVANTTIYIGGVPVGVVGNTLTVAGEAVLSNDSNTAITTTGNITAEYFIGNGSQLTGLPEQYGNANVAAYLPGYTGNLAPGNILTDNYRYANGAPFVSSTYGNADVAAYLPDYGGNILINRVTGNTADNSGYMQWDGNSSGDNNGYTTLRLVPDETLIGNDQYLIIDPTEPQHIHIRAGGTIDASSAELYLGGESDFVRVIDSTGVRLQNRTRDNNEFSYVDPTDFNTATWFESGGSFFVRFTAVNAEMGTVVFQIGDDDENSATVTYGAGETATVTPAGSISNLGGGVYRFSVNEAPPANPTTLTGIDFELWTTNTNSVNLQNDDFTVTVADDVRITGADGFRLINTSATEPIRIITDDGNTSKTWTFAADGTLTTPGDIVTAGDITGTAGANTLVLKAQPASNTSIQLNSIVDSVISTVANLEIRTDVSGTAKTWEFGTDGVLTAPGNITATAFIGDGSELTGITGNLDITGTVIEFAAGTTEELITISPDGYAGQAGIQLPRNTYANVYYAQLTNSGGNVRIVSGDGVTSYEWQFNNIGDLTAPGNITATNFLGNIAAANVTGLANVATTGAYADLTGTPTIPSLGDFTITNNIIQTDNGVGGITLSIFGPDAEDPPAFISRDWQFANTGAFTSPGAISATGNITGGNIITTGNVSATRLQNDANLQIRSNVAGTARTWTFDTLGDLNLPAGGNITGSGLITADRISVTGNVYADLVLANAMGGYANVTLVADDSMGGGGFGNLVWDVAGVDDGTLTLADGTGNLIVGNIISYGNISGSVAGFAIGYRDIPQVAFTGNVTMAAADAGKHFYSTESTDYILTIADNSAVSWPVGTAITVVNRGTGNITVAQASGVSLYLAGNSSAGNRTVTTYGMATVLNVAANVWMINGTGVS